MPVILPFVELATALIVSPDGSPVALYFSEWRAPVEPGDLQGERLSRVGGLGARVDQGDRVNGVGDGPKVPFGVPTPVGPS